MWIAHRFVSCPVGWIRFGFLKTRGEGGNGHCCVDLADDVFSGPSAAVRSPKRLLLPFEKESGAPC